MVKMKPFCLIVLLYAIHTQSAAAMSEIIECHYPPPEDIDWGRLKGDWYHILRTSGTVEGCFKLIDIKKVDTGSFVSQLFTQDLFGEKLKDGNLHMHWIKLPSGYYNIDGDHHGHENLKKLYPHKAALKRHTSAVYTDHENYIMILECAIEGDKFIHVVGPKPAAIAEDVLRIRNKLISLGNGWEQVPLDLYECTEEELKVLG